MHFNNWAGIGNMNDHTRNVIIIIKSHPRPVFYVLTDTCAGPRYFLNRFGRFGVMYGSCAWAYNTDDSVGCMIISKGPWSSCTCAG